MNNSLKLYEKVKNVVPSGTHSNSRARVPHPIFFKEAKGAYITDVDNNTYLDLTMGNGSIIFGHDYEPFKELMKNYLPKGLITGVESELSVDTAKMFLEFVDHERVRFTNSGTEAINHVIHMARAFSGKNDVAVMEGSYNGWTDHVNVSCWPDLSKAGDENRPVPLPGSGGLDERVVKNTVVLPYNNWEATKQIIKEEHKRLACVILEPVMIDVGFIEPKDSYLQNLKLLCQELNIVLVFDELLTGFRMSLGGAQQFYGIKPDISIFGKAIANGYMLAAVAGNRDIMETSVPGGGTSFVGTYNGHQVSLAAARAVFELMKDGEVHKELNKMTDILKGEFNNSCSKYGIDGQLVGRGGHIHWYFAESPVETYRQAANSNHHQFEQFTKGLIDQNLLVNQKTLSHHKLSYSHRGEPLEKIIEAMDKSLKNLR